MLTVPLSLVQGACYVAIAALPEDATGGIGLEVQVGRPLVAGPTAEVAGGPGGQVEAFQVRQPCLNISPDEEQQGLDNPPEPEGVLVEPVQNALVLLDRARAAAGDLDRGDQGGQRGAELVRRLAGELPLAFQRLVQAVE